MRDWLVDLSAFIGEGAGFVKWNLLLRGRINLNGSFLFDLWQVNCVSCMRETFLPHTPSFLLILMIGECRAVICMIAL